MTQLVGGRYEIVRKIAEGGMGAVFEAKHHMTKKTVALKVLFPHIGKDEASKQRFFREVSAAAEIAHPGIVDCFDSGVDPNDGSLFVAMELLQGDTMTDWLMRGGHSRDDILDFMDRVLEPLAAAHSRGIVHRDLKPDNVFLSQQPDGSVVVKILDFGIARDLDTSKDNVTRTGIAMGTPHYMAPEQAMSARGVLATADVWALGVMLYEALTGRTPFDGETASAIVVHACTQPHPPIQDILPDLSPPIAQLVDRCLDKTPQNRPANAAELQQLLRQARGGRTASQGGALSVSTPAARGQEQMGAGNTGFGTNPGAGGGFGSSPGFGAPQGAPTGGGMPTGPGMPHTQPGGPATGPGMPPTQHGGPSGMATQPGGPQTGPGGFGMAPQAAPPASGGSKTGLIIGVVVGLLVLAGGGVAALVLLGGDDDPQPAVGTDPQTPQAPVGGIGTVTISTDIQGGAELLVDGQSQGLVVGGQQVRISSGPRNLELKVDGMIVASQMVQVMPNATTTAQLMRGGNGPESVTTGQLQAGDRTLQTGEFADHYTYQWQSGNVHIEARSSAFDAYLVVKSPSGQQHDNDDMNAGGNDTTAGLDLAITEPGTWTVIVTSYQPGESGQYQLVVRGP
ncbi:MAG: protein kinase [Deltaproteobacteria bacterium]|nr:protein kinase [Deltaproteobacteria bacterium]